MSAAAIIAVCLILLATPALNGQAQEPQGLPEGVWVQNPATGHYYTSAGELSWEEADAQAKEWGGYLVTLNNREEEAWVRSVFSGATYFWLGFHDIEYDDWVIIFEPEENDTPYSGPWRAIIEALAVPEGALIATLAPTATPTATVTATIPSTATPTPTATATTTLTPTATASATTTPTPTLTVLATATETTRPTEASAPIAGVTAAVRATPAPNLTEQTAAIARPTDQQAATSGQPEAIPSRSPVLLKELPGIPSPSDISLEPEVIAVNLLLALISVLFFGFTSTVFNSIWEEYLPEITAVAQSAVPRTLTRRFKSETLPAGFPVLRRWLAVLSVTALVESFLRTGPLVSYERLGVFLALLLAAIGIGGIHMGSDSFLRRRWGTDAHTHYLTFWSGIWVVMGCVIISRAVNFQPGYLYGSMGALTILPALTDSTKAGRRSLIALLAVLVGALLAWLVSPVAARASADLGALLLTLFITGLQGVFFALIPLSVTDGGDIWRWRKLNWGVFTSVVFFLFYHFILNPESADVRFLQQNGVQTVLVLYGIFGTATLLLWLLFPVRLRRAGRR